MVTLLSSLSCSLHSARVALQLDEYQEQPYLLDPHLESLLSPLLAGFRAHIKQPQASLSTARLERVSHLIYFFTKVRGPKTIGPSCPSPANPSSQPSHAARR